MKRVVVAPLDWGLGHATRCIPIIRELQRLSCEVIIAGSGDSIKLLMAEFPVLKSFELPGYRPRYPNRRGSMVAAMAMQLPHFIRVIRREHAALSQIVEREQADAVISDNRYGCFSNRVPSAFITHQSNILMPKRFGWLAPIVRTANLTAMKRFSEIWIPDRPNGNGISGELSTFPTDVSLTTRYLGFLSRFQGESDAPKQFDLAVVLSGPEPQRTLLEQTVTKQLASIDLRYHMVRGTFDPKADPIPNASNYLTTDKLETLLNQSDVVLARCGYSTVMDLARLNKRAILVPTPQQTEQQYLASYLSAKGFFHTVQQMEINLLEDMKKARQCSGVISFSDDSSQLTSAINSLLNL